jgi:hypothetical protein
MERLPKICRTCTCRCSRGRRACSSDARRYTRESYWLVARIRDAAGVALSTDMIVGSRETDADFEERSR